MPFKGSRITFPDQHGGFEYFVILYYVKRYPEKDFNGQRSPDPQAKLFEGFIGMHARLFNL